MPLASPIPSACPPTMSKTILPLLLVLTFFSAPLDAQNRQLLRRREIERTGAVSLRDAVAAARPDWLFMGGDTADAASAARVIVFVDGSELGDLGTLRAIRAARVESVLLRAASTVRQLYPPLAGREFRAALFVSTLTPADPDARVRRVSVSVNTGIGIASQGARVRSSFADAGYSSVLPPYQAWARKGDSWPLTYGAVLHYAARGSLGAELDVQHTPKAFFGGIRPADQPVVSGFFTTSEGAVMATWSRRVARAGVGVAYRATDWELSRTYCQCEDNQSATTAAFGLAAGVTMQLPADAGWLVHVRAQARYFPSHKSPEYTGPGAMDVGGLTIYSGIGIGLRL